MSSRNASWMWAEALEMLDRAEKLRRQFFHPRQLGGRKPCWEPPIDFYETDEDFRLVVALPGVPADRVEVLTGHGLLRITAERPMPAQDPSYTIHRLELPYGEFQRVIELPPGHLELARKEVVDGCLLLVLRKI